MSAPEKQPRRRNLVKQAWFVLNFFYGHERVMKMKTLGGRLSRKRYRKWLRQHRRWKAAQPPLDLNKFFAANLKRAEQVYPQEK